MQAPRDVAAIRLDNALALFEEFVRVTARHADAATLRGLEGRFAERLLIQPSYWSQIKGRSRQIGERLARQFETCCHKPAGWMDELHGVPGAALAAPGAKAPLAAPNAREGADSPLPQDDDERFIVGLVLTYYRRHPQRARTRLLDLLGEVLMPTAAADAIVVGSEPGVAKSPVAARPEASSPRLAAPDPAALWVKTRAGVVPLKKKR